MPLFSDYFSNQAYTTTSSLARELHELQMTTEEPLTFIPTTTVTTTMIPAEDNEVILSYYCDVKRLSSYLVGKKNWG